MTGRGPRGAGRRGRPAAGLPATLALLLAAGCAGALGSGGGAGDPADRRSPAGLLAASLTALDSSDHATAARLLGAVRERCGPSPARGRATALLAAVHLDPRNETPSPQRAAELAAEYLRSGVGPAWSGPVVRVLYLEALEKGAEPPDPAGLEAPETAVPADGRAAPVPEACRAPELGGALASSGALPSLPGTAMADRLEQLEKRIAALREELKRIRAILDEP